MRLICPNCDAQYEVDDNVIPKGGRDVQCSSCGQTWFQESATQLGPLEQAGEDRVAAEAEAAEKSGSDAPATPEPTPEPDHDTAPEVTPEPDPEPAQESVSESAPEPDLEPQKHDEAVLDVLRQEAALETEARQNEARSGLETQPDLGIDQADDNEASVAAAISQRTARLRGIEPEINKNAPRSDLLPDIEEINSSLQAESAIETEDAIAEKQRGRSGFRLGFGLIIILATLLFLAYIYAPQIVEKLPETESFMISYVEKVDGLRLWLDQLMKSATDKMSTGDS